MYDKGKIIIGLVIFVILVSFPFWFHIGQASYEPPDLQLPEEEEDCIEPTQWMRDNHMELLDVWRDKVVREVKPIYVSSTGEKMEISLQKTCMDCHTSKEKFCDRCHNKASVSPYCWDCHVAPEEVENEQ